MTNYLDKNLLLVSLATVAVKDDSADTSAFCRALIKVIKEGRYDIKEIKSEGCISD